MLRPAQSFIALLCFGCLPLSASNTAVAQSFKTELVISGLQKPSGINLDVYGNLYYSEIPTLGTGDGANRVVRLNANRKRSVVVSAGIQTQKTFRRICMGMFIGLASPPG